MNTAEMGPPALHQVICDIEEVVENANLLAMELALKAGENEESSGALSQELNALRLMANRAMAATEEIERLIRGLRTF